ncbi:Mycobacterium numidiamassiliense ORFan, partial [Mycobacterium numidiamassiliense]
VALPEAFTQTAYLVCARANAIGHGELGSRDRTATNIFLLVSTLLSAVAAAGVLTDFCSKTVVGLISLAATLATLMAIACLQMMKADQHLRLQAEYEALYLKLLECGSPYNHGFPDPSWEERFRLCREEFQRIVVAAGSDKASIKDRQAKEYRKRAEVSTSGESVPLCVG